MDFQSSGKVYMTKNCGRCGQSELITAPCTCIPSMGTRRQKALQGITSCLYNSFTNKAKPLKSDQLIHPSPDPALKVSINTMGQHGVSELGGVWVESVPMWVR